MFTKPPVGFEPTMSFLADLQNQYLNHSVHSGISKCFQKSFRWGSNPRPLPYQESVLPLNYENIFIIILKPIHRLPEHLRPIYEFLVDHQYQPILHECQNLRLGMLPACSLHMYYTRNLWLLQGF